MSHDNHMRDRDTDGPTLTELMRQRAANVYQPKHLKQYDDSWDHCCFSGCTPMGCPGGCCANMGWHRASCQASPWRQFDEADHDIYVANGMRQHLASLSPRKRRCGCGDIARYVNGCGPSGCLNRPA